MAQFNSDTVWALVIVGALGMANILVNPKRLLLPLEAVVFLLVWSGTRASGAWSLSRRSYLIGIAITGLVLPAHLIWNIISKLRVGRRSSGP